MTFVTHPNAAPRRELARRGLALLLMGTVLALMTLLGLGAPAKAVEEPRCTCQQASVASQARAANEIFAGVVSDVERDPVANNPNVFNDTYTVTVESIYKGDLSTVETTVRTDRVFGQCNGVFSAGTSVMVFAQTGEPLKVRGCAGTAEADDALVNRIESIFGAGTSPVPPTPFEVTYTAPQNQPGSPRSITRAAAPGLAVVLVSLASLVVVRRLGRPRA